MTDIFNMRCIRSKRHCVQYQKMIHREEHGHARHFFKSTSCSKKMRGTRMGLDQFCVCTRLALRFLQLGSFFGLRPLLASPRPCALQLLICSWACLVLHSAFFQPQPEAKHYLDSGLFLMTKRKCKFVGLPFDNWYGVDNLYKCSFSTESPLKDMQIK